MVSPATPGNDLITGMKLTLEEFLRRWETLPDLKKAELIDGVVYVPSPVGADHCSKDAWLTWWLCSYAVETPGCDAGNNGTWLMLGQSPQPDSFLRILPSHGGAARVEQGLLEGSPELATEICVSSSRRERGPKLALYQRAGVNEYIMVEWAEKRIVWRALAEGQYNTIEADADGVLKSRCFPGLWLDIDAYFSGDRKKISRTLRSGLATTEHAQFVEELARRAADTH